MKKIIRTVCLFAYSGRRSQEIEKLKEIARILEENGFCVQTKRICLTNYYDLRVDDEKLFKDGILLSFGTLFSGEIDKNLDDFLISSNKTINLDLTNGTTVHDVEILFKIIKKKPDNTFRFAYSFNLPTSSPYFPSAKFGQKGIGFSVGLQSTDLSENCNLYLWLEKMAIVWEEIDSLLESIDGYLGIDSSIAPLFQGSSSLVNFVKRLGMDFSHSVTTDIYTTISKFIKDNNPKPIGLCGLMFPCLEDFEIAEEYEKGNFSIERNLFLSLHSGTGIDTYPIGVDEDKEKVLEVLKLVRALSNKYNKPLSVRFVSDGKAKIGEKTNFKNQYLKDVVVREL